MTGLFTYWPDHRLYKEAHAIGRATGFDDENIEAMLDDLIEEVERCSPVFFSANSFDTPMEFDLNLAKQKSNQNPVYYVQYAHARIANIIERLKFLYYRRAEI